MAVESQVLERLENEEMVSPDRAEQERLDR